MRKHHSLLYFIEFAIIGSAFAFLLAFPMLFYRQLLVIGLALFMYMVIGLLHHRTHHDIGMKVVLEYILLSALVFALFVLLNISRL
jgi:hypothetical protein